MALGRRKPHQADLFIPTAHLATGPGHPFYCKLDQVLVAAGFDAFVEEKCAPFSKDRGRPSIPPGVYFRMLLVEVMGLLPHEREATLAEESAGGTGEKSTRCRG